ncbi:hypothetical protein SHIRM173S_01349 [Streptomyces hirsutus]
MAREVARSSQSYVQTLVIVGMIVALIMLVVGSNLARAFSLVGALSVVRFRNAVKETRDVGFIFMAMAIGMACGARFYTLAAVGAVVICAVVLVMFKFNSFALNVQRQVVKVQVPAGEDYTPQIRDVLIKYTSEFELVSTETIRGGALNEVFYTGAAEEGCRARRPGQRPAGAYVRPAGHRFDRLRHDGPVMSGETTVQRKRRLRDRLPIPRSSPSRTAAEECRSQAPHAVPADRAVQVPVHPLGQLS